MKTKESNRLKNIKSYPFADIDNIADNLRNRGIKVIDFGVGDPSDPTPEFIREAVKHGVDQRKSSGYPNYQGSYEFREAISGWMQKRFGVTLDPSKEICSTLGSKEAIFNFPECLINPSDIVICPSPGYPPYNRGTVFAEGIPYFYPIIQAKDFYPDFDSIPETVIKKARLIWVNYPNSPSGKVADDNFYYKLIEFAQKHEIIIGSDEAYSEIYFGPRPKSILEFGKDGIIVFQSLSKRSAMTCYRVGFVAGDARLVDMFRKLKTNIDSGTPSFIQDAAIAALQDEDHVIKMRESYKRKRDILIKAFIEAGLPDCTPEGTLYIWQKVYDGMTGDTFAQRLLKEDIAVVCTPGSSLSGMVNEGYNPGENFVRFALVPSEQDTMEAARRIQKANF